MYVQAAAEAELGRINIPAWPAGFPGFGRKGLCRGRVTLACGEQRLPLQSTSFLLSSLSVKIQAKSVRFSSLFFYFYFFFFIKWGVALKGGWPLVGEKNKIIAAIQLVIIFVNLTGILGAKAPWVFPFITRGASLRLLSRGASLLHALLRDP